MSLGVADAGDDKRREPRSRRRDPASSIRSKLLWLVVACVLPGVLGSPFLAYHVYQREHAQLEQGAIQTAHALASLVDRDLATVRMAGQALATSPHLASNDLEAFYKQAAEISQQVGNVFVLSDETGQQIVNTVRPFGDALPRHANLPLLRRIFETGQPVVSDIYIGALVQRPVMSIDVPVWRDGRVVYDLSGGVSPERLGRILREQNLPPDWIAAVFDSAGVVVARTHQADRFVGQAAAPGVQERLRATAEGIVETRTLEGIPSFIAFSRSSVSNWTVAIASPKESLLQDMWTFLAVLGLGAMALFGVGVGVAWAIGGRFARSLDDTNGRLLEQQLRLSKINGSLRQLGKIASLPQTSEGERLEEALKLGVEHLGLELGIISRIEGSDYQVVYCCAPAGAGLVKGMVFDRGKTYCDIVLKAADVVAIPHMARSDHAGHPCYEAFKLECYIGTPIRLGERLFGTVNFSSAQPYGREFDDGDLEFLRLLGSWVGTVLEEEELHREMRRLATIDALTGVLNRRRFMELATQEFDRAHRYRRPLAMLMLDVDYFKRINDTHGHATGDTVLVEIAKACSGGLREQDIFGRMGGEEFAIALPETDVTSAREVAERLRRNVSAIAAAAASDPIHVTASIGVSSVDDRDTSVDDVLRRADEALYRAKAGGRNRTAHVLRRDISDESGDGTVRTEQCTEGD